MSKPELLTSTSAPESPKLKCRWLTHGELKDRGIHYSDQHLKRLEAKGMFPRRVPVGENRVGWIEAEVDEHQEERNALRDAPRSAAPKRPVPPVPEKKPAKKGKPAAKAAGAPERSGRAEGRGGVRCARRRLTGGEETAPARAVTRSLTKAAQGVMSV
jgi:prophage regulatory protein